MYVDDTFMPYHMYVCMYVNILTVCDIRIHCRADLAVVFCSSCFNGQRAGLAVVFPMHSSSAGGTIRVRGGHLQVMVPTSPAVLVYSR